MPQPFAITTVATHARLDAERRAEITFTISNMTAGPVDGRARVETADPAAGTWFSLAGEAERRFPVAGTEQYVVQMAIPAQAPPGQYAFRLNMVDVENPDEGYAEGPAVTFEVPALEPSRPFPWWIVATSGGVLALVAVIVLIFWPRGPLMPRVAGLAFGDAQATLTAVGLNVAEMIEVTEADVTPGCVTASTPGPGERVTSRSAVVLAVAAAPTATPTHTPTPTRTSTATPTHTPTPTATPTPVPPVRIRVTVERFVCLMSDDEGPGNAADMSEFRVWANAYNRKGGSDPGIRINPENQVVYAWKGGEQTMHVNDVHRAGTSIDLAFDAQNFDYQLAKLQLKAYAREYDSTSSDETATSEIVLLGDQFFEGGGKHEIYLYSSDFTIRVDITLTKID